MPIGFVANALGVACVILNPLRTGGTDVNSTPSARHGGDTTSRRWRGLRIDAILRARLAFAWAANRRNRYAVAGTVCIDRDTRRCIWNAQFRRFLEYWGDQSTSGALLRVVTPECPDPSTSSNQNKKLLEGAATFDSGTAVCRCHATSMAMRPQKTTPATT